MVSDLSSTDQAIGVPMFTMVNLLAGGVGGAGNADDTGGAARFNGLSGVAVDSTGNLYVADTSNHVIRKVVIATGVVTTLAGTTGIAGSVNGTGSAARFSQPRGVALDGAGNLYVADMFSSTIRKVVIATGDVTTLAGQAGVSGGADGTGSAARFYQPHSLVADSTGNLYVADTENHAIRKVVIATGVVTTLAGTTGVGGNTNGTGAAARFFQPRGVTVDSLGNLYVTDSFNNTIRQVVIATGVTTTLAGMAGFSGGADGTGAAARFAAPYGVTEDGAGNLYVGDSVGNTIRRVVTSSGVVTTVAGTVAMQGSIDATGSAARFSANRGVALDGAGNLYVADAGNHTIRKVVVATAVVTTLAGSAVRVGSTDATGAAARFNFPHGMAADGAGNLYVADTSNHTIRKVVRSSGVVTTLAGTASMPGITDATGAAARFNSPYGMVVDGAGNLYVADSRNYSIRKIVLSSGVVTTVAGSSGSNGSIDGTGTAARFDGPRGLALDSAGNLYVADTGGDTIRKVELPTGVVTTLAGSGRQSGSADGTGATARFNGPQGVALDGVGNLYVADNGNHTIRKIVVATGVVTTLAGRAGMFGYVDGSGTAARFNFPYDVAADPVGNLYVADLFNNAIRHIDLTNAAVTTKIGVANQIGIKPGPLPARLNQPRAVAALSVSSLFITDLTESVILEVR